MIDFEKEVYEGLKEKEACDYTCIDTIVILSEIIGNAKNNINTNRGRNEAREFETIIEEAANSVKHKYSELLECVEKMEFIKKEMKNIPEAETYFDNAVEWLEINKDKCVEQGSDYYYVRASFGNMFKKARQKSH